MQWYESFYRLTAHSKREQKGDAGVYINIADDFTIHNIQHQSLPLFNAKFFVQNPHVHTKIAHLYIRMLVLQVYSPSNISI